MKKKMFGLILLICILCIPFVASAANSALTDVKSKTELLTNIGIVDEIDVENPISCAQLAKYLYRIYDIKCTEEEALQYSIDMGWLDDEDYSATEVNYNILCQMAVSALRYNIYADANGGVPKGYVSMASKLDLTDAVERNSDGKVTGADVINVLYAMLDVDMPKIQIIGGEIDYGTPLSVMGIHKSEGVVTAVKGETLMGEQVYSADQVRINSVLYEVKSGNAKDFFAKNVTYYYNDDNELLYMHYDEDDIKKIDASVFVSYTYNNGQYNIKYRDLKEKTYNVKAKPKYISVNSDKLTAFADIKDALKFNYGGIELIDYDNDKKYDVMLISKYENYFVSFAGSGSLYDQNKNEAIEFDFDDEDYTYTFYKDGKEIEYSEITANSIISVYKNTAGTEMEIYVSDAMVRGTIESTKNLSDGLKKYVIDGFPYYTKLVTNEIAIDDTVTFFLDINGNIGGYEKSTITRDMEYGYLIKLYDDDIDEKIIARIFTKNGDVVDFETSKSTLSVEYKYGSTKYTFSEIKTNFSNNTLFDGTGKFIPQLVKFTARDGVLKKLVVSPPEEEYDDSCTYFQLADSGDGQYYNKKLGRFAVRPDTDTWVLAVPVGEGANNYSKYQNSYGLVDKGTYPYKMYDVDDFLCAKVMVVEISAEDRVTNSKKINRDDYFSVVQNIESMEEWDEENGVVRKVWLVTMGVNGTGTAEYKVHCGPYGLYRGQTNLAQGSVILDSTTDGKPICIDTSILDEDGKPTFLNIGDVGQPIFKDGYLVAFLRWYDAANDWMPIDCGNDRTPVSGYNVGVEGDVPTGAFWYGKVVRMSNTLMVIDCSNDDDRMNPEYSRIQYLGKNVISTDYAYGQGYIFDRSNNDIVGATAKDIRIGDDIVINNAFGNLRSFVAFRGEWPQ